MIEGPLKCSRILFSHKYVRCLSLSLSLSLPSFHDVSPQNAIGAWYVNTTLPEGL